MTTYSYNDVFSFFSKNHCTNLVMAMYYPEESIVVTDTDILI